MARLSETFNAADLPVSEGYDLVPAGWYEATAEDVQLAMTKDGTGQYMKIKWRIQGPTHANRVLFGNINVINASPQAEQIGRAQLGELMRAVGLAQLQDSDELIGAACQIKVGVREARTDQNTGKTYDASNDVKGFKPASNAAPAAMPKSAAPAAPAAPARTAPPWAKK